MNDNQKAHLKSILDETHTLILNKYVRGAMEHQSQLNIDYTVEQLVDFAIEEAIDQITYLLTLKAKLTEVKSS